MCVCMSVCACARARVCVCVCGPKSYPIKNTRCFRYKDLPVDVDVDYFSQGKLPRLFGVSYVSRNEIFHFTP
jgi:hypothetical protein